MDSLGITEMYHSQKSLGWDFISATKRNPQNAEVIPEYWREWAGRFDLGTNRAQSHEKNMCHKLCKQKWKTGAFWDLRSRYRNVIWKGLSALSFQKQNTLQLYEYQERTLLSPGNFTSHKLASQANIPRETRIATFLACGGVEVQQQNTLST